MCWSIDCLLKNAHKITLEVRMSVQSTVRRAVALALEGVTGPAISLPASRVAAKAAGRAAEKVVGRAAGGDVRRSIRRGVERAVRRAVRGAVRSGYGREIAGYVGRAVGTAVGKTVGIAVVRSVSNAVGKEVATAVGRAIGRLVRKTVKKTIGKEVRKNAEKIARKITERAAIEAAERKGGRRDAAVIGVAIGRAIGRVFGKTVGKAVGKAAGRVVGKAIGRAVGIAVGKAVGRAVGHTMGTAVGGAVGEVIGKAVTKAIEKTIGRKQSRYFAGVTSEDALMLDLKATNIIGNQVKDYSASSDIGESDLSIAESGNVTIETVESDFISDTGTTDLSTSTNKTANVSLESDVTDFIRSDMSIVEERKHGNMKNENGENPETNDMGTISETFVRVVVEVVNADSVKYSKATPWSVIHTCGKAVKMDDIETLFDANNHSMALEHCLGRKLDSEVKMEKAIFVGDLEEFFRTNNEVSKVVNSTDLEEIYLPIDMKAVEGCSKVYTGGNKTDNTSVYEEIPTGVPIQGISADTGQRQTHANTMAYSKASPRSIIHTFSRRVQRENIETLFDAKNHSMALEHCLERKLDSEVNVEKTNLIANVEDFIRTNNGDSSVKLTGDLEEDSFSVDMKSVGEGCSKFYPEVNKTTHSSVSEETLIGVQFEEINACLEQRQIHADANPVTYFKAFTCSVIHTPSKDVEREDIETFVDANNHSMAREHCFESKLESEVNEENSNCIVNVGDFVRTNNVASSVNSAEGLEEDSLSIDMKSIAEGCSKFYAGSKTVTSSVFEETLIDVTIEEIKADLGQLQIHADSDPVTYSKASTCSVEKDDTETLFYARNHSMALTHFFERKFDSEANVEKNNLIANLEDFIKPNNGDGSVNLSGNLVKDSIPIDMRDVAEGCRKLYAEKVYKTATSSLSEETLIGIPFEEINTDLRQRQIHADVDLETHSEASTCSVILTPNEEAETDDIETLVDPNDLSMDMEPCFGRKLDSELKVEKNNFIGDMKGFIRTNNGKRTKNLSLNLKEDSLAIDIKAIAGSCSKSDAKENETATNEYMEGLSLTSNLNALYEIFDNISNAEIFTDVASNPYTSEVENLNLEDTRTIDLKADLHTNTSKITKTGITDPIIVCTGRISKAKAGKSLGERLERNMTEELDITDDIVVEVSDKSIDSSCSKQAIALIADSRPKRPRRDPEEIFQPINTESPADTLINSFADNLVTSYTDSEELIKLNDEAASWYVTKNELEENIQTTFLNAFNESICTEKIEGENITTSLVSTDSMESVCEALTEASTSFVKLFREECTSEDDRKTINTKVTQLLVNANFDASNSETESIDETLLSCSALEFVEKVCSEEIDTFSEKSDSKSVFTISDKTILEFGKSNSDVIIKKIVTSDLPMTLQSSKIYVDEGIEVINETVINTGIFINTVINTLGMDGGDTPEKKEAGTAKRCPIIPIEDNYKLDNNTVSVSTSTESPTEKLGLGQGDETPHPQNEEETHVDSVDMSTCIANEIIDNIISRVYEKTMLTKNVSKLKDIADVHLEENSSQMSLKVNKCLFKRSNKWKDSYGIRSNWRKHSRKEVWKPGNPWSQD